MNGGGMTVYMGRAASTVFAGRAMPTILAGQSTGIALMPRNAMCAPVVQCCCKGPVNVGPGDIAVIPMNWATWLGSIPGYQAHKIAEASLWDMTQVPPVPADPAIIKVTSGVPGVDPDPVDNADVAGLISVIPPVGVQISIEASKNARIGDQYKLNVCITARDCDGRMARQCDCVVIVIAEC